MLITSSQNKIVKKISALTRKKERNETKLFIAEGERIVKEIPPQWQVCCYAVSQSYSKGIEKADFFKTDKIYIISDDIFAKISDTVTPQGIIALCRQKTFDISDVLNKENPFIVLLENISDPGNAGTIIRTADAAGADSVILTHGCVDLYNPKLIRSTMGSVFHLPIITEVSSREIMTVFKKKGIKTFASHLKAHCSVYEADLSGAAAVLIGNEANGLTPEITELADCLVKIPMPGLAESMNASAAAAVLIYEGLRQRLYL